MTRSSSAPMELVQGITEEVIREIVMRFYSRVRADPELGPIFVKAVSHRWDDHLSNMVDFWSSVALRTGRYHGKPHLAHAGLGLSSELFQRWLALFTETVEELCQPDVGAFFADRATRIADSLQIGLGLGPKALRLGEHSAARSNSPP